MKHAVNETDVQPPKFAGQPQTHFSRLRLDEDYHVSYKGSHVKGSRVVKKDITQMLDKFKVPVEEE